ncbi:MAG: hypothetical protein K9N00_02155 [Candidatus Marinimicrobia bacterium]|nr:hypothetical protein [Candidatus Neomarinimicrobiota bacterium]
MTNIEPIKLAKSQIVKKLYATSEIEAMKIVIEKFKDLYLIVDLEQKFKLVILDTPEIMPLKYYQSPNVLKQIRIKLGYTQKEFGRKLGFHSKRRGRTVSEKEKGRLPICDRDARNLRYLSVFGDLD